MKSLDKVLEILLSLREDQFSIEYWRREVPGGVIACPIGWYIMGSPLLTGLEFVFNGDLIDPTGIRVSPNQHPDVRDFEAISREFGITLGEALYLFSMDAYDSDISLKAVVARLTEFIQKVLAIDSSFRQED